MSGDLTEGPKLCECGCGQPTKVAAKTRRSRGWVKGQPLRFLHGHSGSHEGGPMVPIRIRFNAKVNKLGPIPQHRPELGRCWIWLGAKSANGYGNLYDSGRYRPAHCVSHELHKGPIRAGLQVDHLCRTPICVNPDHLEAVTASENILRSHHYNRKLGGRH